MANSYIPVVTETWESEFGKGARPSGSSQWFDLVKPFGQEMYYRWIIRENTVGKLELRVYTSIKTGETISRPVGADAIRISLVWSDSSGMERGLGKSPRVYRSGGEKSTATDIVQRAKARAREVYVAGRAMAQCDKCGRPMTEVEGKNGKFLSCIGWRDSKCSNTCSIK